MNKIQENVEKLDKENAEIKKAIETLKNSNIELEDKYEKIKNEKEEMKKDIENLKKSNIEKDDKYEAEKEKMKKDIENLKNSNIEIKDKYEKNEERLKEMKNKLEIMLQEHEGLKVDMMKSEELANYYRDINNDLIQKSLNNNQTMVEYLMQINNLKRDNFILKNENENMHAYLNQKNLDEQFNILKNKK